jgi:hypothetical protein
MALSFDTRRDGGLNSAVGLNVPYTLWRILPLCTAHRHRVQDRYRTLLTGTAPPAALPHSYLGVVPALPADTRTVLQ